VDIDVSFPAIQPIRVVTEQHADDPAANHLADAIKRLTLPKLKVPPGLANELHHE